MNRSRVKLVAALAVSVLGAGCQTVHCHTTGSQCTYQRYEPTAAQRSGVSGASVAARLPAVRRRVGPTVKGLLLNRWGEIWVEVPGGKRFAFNHSAELVRQSFKVSELVPTGDPIPLRDVDGRAIDRALRKIARIRPGQPFVKASLTRDDFLYGGLRWELMVGSDEHHFYATFDAAPDGSAVCETSVFDHGRTPPVHRCPKFGHQPPGIGHAF